MLRQLKSKLGILFDNCYKSHFLYLFVRILPVYRLIDRIVNIPGSKKLW
jgi:hypothetical protein